MANETRTPKSKLGRITNMVVSKCPEITDIFIATSEGEFGRFTIQNKEASVDNELRYKELDLQGYLSETQHHIGHKNIGADYASRRVEDRRQEYLKKMIEKKDQFEEPNPDYQIEHLREEIEDRRRE